MNTLWVAGGRAEKARKQAVRTAHADWQAAHAQRAAALAARTAAATAAVPAALSISIPRKQVYLLVSGKRCAGKDFVGDAIASMWNRHR